MESATSENSPTAMETNQTFASTGSTAKINFGQIKILTIILITIGFTVIQIGLTMLILRAAVVLRGDGVCQREGVFWMRRGIIVGRTSLRMTRGQTWFDLACNYQLEKKPDPNCNMYLMELIFLLRQLIVHRFIVLTCSFDIDA